MTGSQLKSWRLRLGMNLTQAADALGVSLDTYARMEKRPQQTKLTALACAAISHGLPPAVG